MCLYAGETRNEGPVIVGLITECQELLTEFTRGQQPEDYRLTRANSAPTRHNTGVELADALDSKTISPVVQTKGLSQKTRQLAHRTTPVFTGRSLIDDS